MSLQETILNAAEEIKSEYPTIFQYEGFGYCGFASALLHNKLKKKNVESHILVGRTFSSTLDATKAKNKTIAIIETMPSKDDGSYYYNIKKAYIENNHKLPKVVGHGVLLIKNKIYDMTSGQFGLPFIYPLSLFLKTWVNIEIAAIKVGDIEEDFGIKEITKIQDYNPNISLEHILNTNLLISQ